MDKKLRPPRLLEWLLRRFLRTEDAFEKLGDFEECYRETLREKGRLAAAAWYTGQIIRAIPAFIADAYHGSTIMFKSYLTAAVRNLTRNRTYSLLNVLGLAVGIAAFLVIGLYVAHELGHDRQHRHAERIFKVIYADQAVTPVPFAPALMSEFPEVETATRLVRPSRNLVRHENRSFFGDQWVWADECLFDVFTFPLAAGDSDTALRDPNSVVISETMARKYFGEEEPLGKILHWTSDFQEADFMVTGVMRDIPASSHVRADIFASFCTLEKSPGYNPEDFNWGNFWVHTFFRLKEGHDPRALEEKYPQLLASRTGVEIDLWRDPERKFASRALTDLHLRSTDLVFHFSGVSDITYVYIFAAVALIILLIAGVNYVNLTTALSIRRFHEIGMRKVMGAQRLQLIRQFLGESLLLTVLALAVALSLAYVFLPFFNRLIQIEQGLDLSENIPLVASLLLVGQAVGLTAGVYPAFFMSGFAPGLTLKSAFSARIKKGYLRNVLVIVQFAISIFLIIGTLVTFSQLHFIRNMDLGYTKERIAVIPIRGTAMRDARQIMKQELLQLAGVRGVCISSTLPMEIDWHNSFYYRDKKDSAVKEIQSHYARVDYDFIDLFELEVIKGRNFQQEKDEGRAAFVINEVVARKIGWADPVGEPFHNQGRTGTIVGMVRDFHNENMHLPKSEVVLVLAPDKGADIMSIKMDPGDIPGTVAAVERVWGKYAAGYPFEYEFMDERYDNLYKSEISLGNAFQYFAILAVFLCCLGLFGLASFTVQQATKEIAVRKVLGASSGTLVRMLSWKFLKWVIIANVIAWPVAWVVMDAWLRSFAYRIDMSWILFGLAGATALVIAFLTVFTRTARAALANPADSLRYE
ncbi:MAG: ABC transporter permease [Acidobacteria bacterium]|nr:ABC transporter permease [Acidobacteriota bacterium]